MKSITDLSRGADDIPSARGGRLRCAPKSKESSYVDLLILHKKQIRLNKERQQLEKKMERNQQQLGDISDEIWKAKKNIEELEMEASGEQPPKIKRGKPARKWQTVTVDY